MSFMSEMPEIIYGGEKGWEFQKVIKRDRRPYLDRHGNRLCKIVETYKFPCPHKEARQGLKDTLNGYKILWNRVTRQYGRSAWSFRFKELVRLLNHGDLLPVDDSVTGYSAAEKIGKAGDFKMREPEYDCCDRYDFGPWTK